jgi:uncharacterized SAM-binding protein YcdF (DUF218 family)
MDLWPRIAELLITPPGVVVVLLLITFLAYLRRNWLGAAMLMLSTIALVILSTPLTAHRLLAGLETYAKPLELVPLAEKGPKASVFIPRDSAKDPPGAIVVIGAGRYAEAPEYGLEDTASAFGLERLRYAATLQRKTGLPILVSGGAPGGEKTAESEFMKAVLTEEFRVNVKWTEPRSRTTRENAIHSAELLRENKIGHILLVTHAFHMRRAAHAFESAGIKVTPAATSYHTLSRAERSLFAYLPSSDGLHLTSLALHERLGYYWYTLKDEADATPKPPATPDAKPAR